MAGITAESYRIDVRFSGSTAAWHKNNMRNMKLRSRPPLRESVVGRVIIELVAMQFPTCRIYSDASNCRYESDRHQPAVSVWVSETNKRKTQVAPTLIFERLCPNVVIHSRCSAYSKQHCTHFLHSIRAHFFSAASYRLAAAPIPAPVSMVPYPP